MTRFFLTRRLRDKLLLHVESTEFPAIIPDSNSTTLSNTTFQASESTFVYDTISI